MADTPEVFRSAAWLELPGKQTYVLRGDCHIGRTAGNEIVNDDKRISRRNSVIQREGTHFLLVDLGSTNGTFLNEQRIFKPTRLKDHDVILVGSERYVFRQPPESDGAESDPAYSLLHRTAVAVGKTACWMVRLAPTKPDDPAAESRLAPVRDRLTASGARVRRLPGGVQFFHWREGRTPPEVVREALLALASGGWPAGVIGVVHQGTVRVGPAADPTEENLLGADVTLTHQLATVVAGLKENLVWSESAVRSLQLESRMRSLADHAVPGVAGRVVLYALVTESGRT